jgi:hypothetical protein
MQFFKAHGYRNHHSYHTFSNPELRVLLLPEVGCMVYTIAAHWGITLVVAAGDPICEPQHDLLMLQTFRNVFPGCMFMDVSKDVATLLAREGPKQPGAPMTATDMGTETTVHVQKYTFDFNQVWDCVGLVAGAGGGDRGYVRWRAILQLIVYGSTQPVWLSYDSCKCVVCCTHVRGYALSQEALHTKVCA